MPTDFGAPSGGKPRRRHHGSAYSPVIARKLCERIMRKETLNAICKSPGMPSLATVVRWLASPNHAEFREMYYYARRVQAEMYIDEIIEIADETADDWKPVYNKNGVQNGWKPDNEAIQRSRVRIDSRKWLAAKLVPRLYGERVDVSHDLTGDLAELLKTASNKDNGLPPPIEGAKKLEST